MPLPPAAILAASSGDADTAPSNAPTRERATLRRDVPGATSLSLTGATLVAGLENGNGDVGLEAFHSVAGSISSGKRYFFKRQP